MYKGRNPYQAPMPRLYGPRAPVYGAQPHHGTPAGNAGNRQMNPQQPSATKHSEQTSATSAKISIGQMRFEPAVITIKKGSTVTWQQKDAMPHTVTADNKSFTSQRLGMNDEFTQTFDDTGVYKYYCAIHPSMRGEVRVVD